MKGTIQKWKDTYGFIEVTGRPSNVFCHQSSFKDDAIPSEGCEVEFELGKSEKGDIATNITIITEDE